MSNGPKKHVTESLKSNLSPKLPSNASQRSYAQSWLAIPRKTRLALSCILFGSALGGLWISNKLEEKMPPQQQSSTK